MNTNDSSYRSQETQPVILYPRRLHQPKDRRSSRSWPRVRQCIRPPFKFLAYTVLIFGAWLGDTKIGRYPTILLGVLICGVAHLTQIVSALLSVLVQHKGAAPFLINLFLPAFGAGIFEPNILPTVLDQYTYPRANMNTLKSGERAIVDPEATISRASLYFYGFTNTRAFFAIATVCAEKHVGFWMAFQYLHQLSSIFSYHWSSS